MAREDWEVEKTVSASEPITIKYVTEDAEGNLVDKEAKLTSTPYSETETTYRTFIYVDEEGKEQTSDNVIKRVTKTRTTAAAANGAYVKWRLEKGLGLPEGDIFRITTSYYTYWVDFSGVRLWKEQTTEEISETEFTGSLAISDYTVFGPFEEYRIYFQPDPKTMILASKTRVEYEWGVSHVVRDTYNKVISQREWTKSTTKRWLAHGLSQEGQQSVAEQIKALDGTDGGLIVIVIEAGLTRFEGVEVRTHTGRAQAPSRPSIQEREAADIAAPSEEDPDLVGAGEDYDSYSSTGEGDGGGAAIGGAAINDLGSPFKQVSFEMSDGPDFGGLTTAEFTMPLAPDDYREEDGGIVRGGSSFAAKAFGDTLNRMRAGHAYGVNITTSVDRLPSQAFAPLYLEAAGISAAMRLDGTSWAFDQNGVVCSSDLFLCGVAGKTEPVTSSWIQASVPTASLPVLAS